MLLVFLKYVNKTTRYNKRGHELTFFAVTTVSNRLSKIILKQVQRSRNFPDVAVESPFETRVLQVAYSDYINNPCYQVNLIHPVRFARPIKPQNA